MSKISTKITFLDRVRGGDRIVMILELRMQGKDGLHIVSTGCNPASDSAEDINKEIEEKVKWAQKEVFQDFIEVSKIIPLVDRLSHRSALTGLEVIALNPPESGPGGEQKKADFISRMKELAGDSQQQEADRMCEALGIPKLQITQTMTMGQALVTIKALEDLVSGLG